jgi:hypothetical protein
LDSKVRFAAPRGRDTGGRVTQALREWSVLHGCTFAGPKV